MLNLRGRHRAWLNQGAPALDKLHYRDSPLRPWLLHGKLCYII